MKRSIAAASMLEETDYEKEWKTGKYARRISFGMVVFLAGCLTSSDSHALIACAPNAVTEGRRFKTIK